MRSRPLIVTLFVTALLGGCVAPSGNYCDIARPIYFERQGTVDWLLDHDRQVLSEITVHNEQVERLCW